MQMRLADFQAGRTREPWLLRGIVLRQTQTLIGHIGFHTPPGPDYLHNLAPGGIEIGYTIFPAYRRQGYALEACTVLIEWAHRHENLCRFVLSIAPDNLASLRIAERLNFTRIGEHIDDIDGAEYIYLLHLVQA